MDKFWMILRTDTVDSSTKIRHDTYGDAMTEIERLVSINPKATFVILEPIAEVFAPKIPLQVKEIK